MSDIPGGFPDGQRLENVVQVRVTPDGLGAVSDNAGSIVDAMFDDGLTFDVPPSCGGDREVCCYVPEGYCQMAFDLDPHPGDLPRLGLEPINATTSELTIRARVHTVRAMPVDQAALFGSVECFVSLDTTWSGTPHITIQADLSFVQDPTTGMTALEVGNASVSNLSASDVAISGGFLCGFGDPADAAAQMREQFADEIPRAVEKLACQKCEADSDCKWGSCNSDGVCELNDSGGRRCVANIATEGRLPAKEILGSLMPNAGRDMDIYIGLGGYGTSPAGGLSLGVLGGAMPAPTGDACVPVVPEPSQPAVARSTVLENNTNPATGETFDLGLGIHESYLNRVAWAAHQAGYLCIDVGAARVPLLTTGTLAILAPSMVDLTHGTDAPLFLSVRPQQPPVLKPGRGTFTEGGDIDEPLLSISMKDMDIDFYALIDQRYVRLLTLTADLDAAVGLTTNELGNVSVVLGDLGDALSNLRVTNSELLDESPQELADKFPAVLSVALPMLADGLGDGEGLALPAFAGLTLQIGDGGFTSIEGDSMLAIFGDFIPASSARTEPVRTEAEIVRYDVPEDAAFTAKRWDRAMRPAVEVALGGSVDRLEHRRAARRDELRAQPPASAGVRRALPNNDPSGVPRSGAPLEWQYRVDRGFWSPFTREPTLRISRESFWLSGRHEIVVRAREVGAPRTLDPVGVLLEFDLESARPERSRRTTAGTAIDTVTLDNNPAQPERSRRPAAVVGFHGRAQSDSGCNCSIGSHRDRGAAVGALVLLFAALLLGLRHPRRWDRITGFGLVVFLALTTACSGKVGGGGDDDDDDDDDTLVHPGPTGRWADLAADGSRVVMSAYEETLGDLVFTVVDADGAVDWAPIDGVPDVPPVLDVNGYRGGVADPGPNVGGWTSIALFDGEARIAYTDIDAGALKYTVEAGGDWPSHVVDPGADAPAGQFASLAVDANGAPGIAYMVNAIPSGDGGFLSQLRWARAATANPSTADDWSIATVAEIRTPCTGLCGAGEVCLADAATCAVEEAEDACGGPCDDDFACVGGTCQAILTAPEAEMLPEGVGLFASATFTPDGRAAIAYYDHTSGDLYLAIEDDVEPSGFRIEGLAVSVYRDAGQWSSLAAATDALYVAYQDAMDDSLHLITWADGATTDELVDDGWRDDTRPHPVGADAELVIDGNGDLIVAYQDAATADVLLARRRAGDTWTRTDVLTGVTPYGFYIGAALSGADLWISSYAYDRAVWPPGETVVTRAP